MACFGRAWRPPLPSSHHPLVIILSLLGFLSHAWVWNLGLKTEYRWVGIRICLFSCLLSYFAIRDELWWHNNKWDIERGFLGPSPWDSPYCSPLNFADNKWKSYGGQIKRELIAELRRNKNWSPVMLKVWQKDVQVRAYPFVAVAFVCENTAIFIAACILGACSSWLLSLISFGCIWTRIMFINEFHQSVTWDCNFRL